MGNRIDSTAVKIIAIAAMLIISVVLTGQISMEYQSIPGESGDLELRGDILFAVAGNALEIYDVSSNRFNLINRIYFNDVLYDIQIQDSLIFISYAYQKGIEVFNAKDPINLIKITNINLRTMFELYDTILFGVVNAGIFGEDTLRAFNISDIQNPLFVSEYAEEYDFIRPEKLSIIDTIIFPRWTFADIYNIKRTTFSDDMCFENVEMIDETLGIAQYNDPDKILCIYNFKDSNIPILIDTIDSFEYLYAPYRLDACAGESLIIINMLEDNDNDERFNKIEVYNFLDPQHITFKEEFLSDRISQRMNRKIPGVVINDNIIFYTYGEDGIKADSLFSPYARQRVDSSNCKYNGGYGWNIPSNNDSSFITKSENRVYRTAINTDKENYEYYDFGDNKEIHQIFDLEGRVLVGTSENIEGLSQVFLLDSNLTEKDSIEFGNHMIFIIPKEDYFYVYNSGATDSFKLQLYQQDSQDEINFIENIEEINVSYIGSIIIDNYLVIQNNDSLVLYDITDIRHPEKKNSVFCRANDYETHFTSKKNYIYSYYYEIFDCCSIFCLKINNDSLFNIKKMSVLNDNNPDQGLLTFVNDYLVLSLTGDAPHGCRNVVYDVSNPENPVFVDTMDIFPFGAGFGIRNYLYGSTYACGYNRIKFGEVKQELTIDGAHDFGTITKNDSLIETHAVINTGGEILTVDSVKGLSRVFSVAGPLPVNISPSDTGYIVFKFLPESVGEFSDTAYVYSNDIYAIYHKIKLSGEGEFLSLIKNDDRKAKTIRKEYLEIYGNKIVFSSLKSGSIKIKVYDISGREILSKTEALKSQSGIMDLKQLIKKAGIYFIRVEMEPLRETKKILIF